MPGQSFERDIVHAFNDYFTRDGVKAIAYRHYQMRFQPQLFDVLVDCRGNELYLALECKSIDTTTVNKVYFKKHFNWQGGVCQVERESAWLGLSGRNGYCVIECRRGPRKRTTVFFVPWRVVRVCFDRGSPAIEQDQITYCPSCDKSGGKYTFDDDFIKELVSSLDSYPKNPRKVTKRSSW
jgi:hypothetical protein